MIPASFIFDEYAGDYDRWFDDHGEVYKAQLRMLRDAVPPCGRGLEMGVGSGRFALALRIAHGIDPSRRLAAMAKARGIEAVQGKGEQLPYRAGTFDSVLMMTVICFIDDLPAAFREALRVLVPGGELIVGFIEKDGEIARQYREEKTKGRFLRLARFRTVDETARMIEGAGFYCVSVVRRTRGFCVMTGKKR